MNSYIKKSLIQILIIAGIFVLPLLAWQQINSWSEGYEVPTGSTDTPLNIGNADGTADSGLCKTVTNNSGTNYYVPTRTTTEWDAFNANAPAGITINDCATGMEWALRVPATGCFHCGWPEVAANNCSSCTDQGSATAGAACSTIEECTTVWHGNPATCSGAPGAPSPNELFQCCDANFGDACNVLGNEECQSALINCTNDCLDSITNANNGDPCTTCGYAGCECQDGLCVTSCARDCTGKSCGDDGCGGTCGNCAGSETCYDGTCYDSACQMNYANGSTMWSYYEPNDWTTVIDEGAMILMNGVGITEPVIDPPVVYFKGEYRDTEFGSNYYALIKCPDPNCVPDCNNKFCGDDGCMGSCGTCSGSDNCYGGKCFDPTCVEEYSFPASPYYYWRYTPVGDISYVVRGGTNYGPNSGVNEIVDGAFIYYRGDFKTAFADDYYSIIQCPNPACAPDCAGKDCGPNGCGGFCGYCGADEHCDITQNCISCLPDHATQGCSNGHVYWLDNCGFRNDLITTCPCGCSAGACLAGCGCVPTANDHFVCNSGWLYWYDSCNNLESSEYCGALGCDTGVCGTGGASPLTWSALGTNCWTDAAPYCLGAQVGGDCDAFGSGYECYPETGETLSCGNGRQFREKYICN